MWWGKAGGSSKGQAKDLAASLQLSLLEAWLLYEQQSCWMRVADARLTTAAWGSCLCRVG